MTADKQRAQLEKQRLKVDFDSYDVTVDELLRRIERDKVDVAPTYQRKFRWDSARQSTLIESILLGIPVPPLFMATSSLPDRVSKWEVVDGLQRVTTLVNYAGAPETRSKVDLKPSEPPLKLDSLAKLTTYNNTRFADLPEDLRTSFEDRPLKVIVLNDKSDSRVRFDLFERLNTGGIRLSHQEVRECVFRGKFIELITELAKTEDFRETVHISERQQSDGTYQEYVLRFFAYLEEYQSFEHSVKGFLDDFCLRAQKDPQEQERRSIFLRTFSFLRHACPDGIRASKKSTPVNLYEALAVGAGLALKQRPDLRPKDASQIWLDDNLRPFIYGATNTQKRVTGRIEFCRDYFLA